MDPGIRITWEEFVLRVSLDEARQRLAELAEVAARGETVKITRDGAPVAELRPARPEADVDETAIEEALRDLDRLQDDPNRSPVTAEERLAWRNEGRR